MLNGMTWFVVEISSITHVIVANGIRMPFFTQIHLIPKKVSVPLAN